MLLQIVTYRKMEINQMFMFYLYKNNMQTFLEATPHKAAAIRPRTTYHENY